MPDIKAAENLDFWPVTSPAAALVAHSLLHAPHQSSDMTVTELLVVQVMDNLFPEISQRPMLCNVLSVCHCGL